MITSRTGRQIGSIAVVVNKNSLRYVTEAVQSQVFGRPLHRTAFDKAAAYAYTIIVDHPFSDGNKRTGLLAAFTFLETNGYFASIDLEDEAIVTVGLNVATGKMSRAQLSDWLSRHFST